MKIYYDKINKRLVFLNEKADASFWDKQWDFDDFKESVKKRSKNQFVYKTTKKFLKPSKKIKLLEGGCGDGHFVYSLTDDYDMYGIDYATKTVKKINYSFPKLKVFEGDVRKINFPDEYFDGYWSLGVIEHFYDGYDDIATEMQRVVKKGGCLFLTFPYMNPLRKLKAKLGLYQNFNKNLAVDNFYQFALDHKIVLSDLKNVGFNLIYKKPRNGTKGLKDEIKFFKPVILKINQKEELPYKIIRKIISLLTNPFCGHSILLVLKKNK